MIPTDSSAPPAEPAVSPKRAVRPTPEIRERAAPRVRAMPLYHVVLLDDDDHTYEYVIEMLASVFGHSRAKAYLMAREVDHSGRVIVETTTLERAELKRDQVHAFGADWRVERCAGSMSAEIEPADV